MLLGNPRSGTSWIGKILDSHPDVLYRHEPDIEKRDKSIPPFLDSSEQVAHLEHARGYLKVLANVRTERTAASLPQFKKRYRSEGASLLFKGGSFVIKGLSKAGVKSLALPDLIKRDVPVPPVLVIKSVSLLGKSPLFMNAEPELKIIHILRHPCGYVASRLAGLELGLMKDGAFVNNLAKTPFCLQKGLDSDYLSSLSPAEQFAWGWVVSNEYALRVLAEHPRYCHVIYDQLCDNPIEESKRMFASCGMTWEAQTEAFVEHSVKGGTSKRYFSVVQNPQISKDRWRNSLESTQIDSILRITEDTLPGQLFR